MGDQRASAGTAGAVNRSVLTIRCFFLWFVLTFAKFNAIVNIISKKLNETVDAEITAMMPLQRACDDENQARNKLSNGPLRAQSKGSLPSILRRCRQTLIAGDMLVSR